MSKNSNNSLEGNKLPSSIAQIGIAMKYELLNYYKSRRFYVMFIIAIAIGGALTGVVAHYGASAFGATILGFYSTWWGLSATYIVIFAGIFFGGDAISGEFQNKTGYFLLANPIRRSTIYIGKWLAALAASAIIFAVFTAITIANGVYYFGVNAFPYQFGESIIFSLIYLLAVLGLTFFFSSLFKSSSMSILVNAILLLFGFQIVQSLIADIAHVEPWILLTYGAGIIGNILNVPYPAHISTVTSFGHRLFTTYTATVPEGLIIMLAYFAVSAILGLFLFEKKEFN